MAFHHHFYVDLHQISMRFILNTVIVLYVVFFFYSSCQKVEHSILGYWELEKVVFDNTDVSSEHNPNNNRYIIFKKDGSFESGGDPVGKNTGFFSISNDTLFLDSHIEGDDSYWKIVYNSDTMVWKGVGTDWHSRHIIYLNKKPR